MANDTFIQIFKKSKELKDFTEPLYINNQFEQDLDGYDLGGAGVPSYLPIVDDVIEMTGDSDVTTFYQSITNLQPDTYYDLLIKGDFTDGSITIFFKSSLDFYDDRTDGDGVYSYVITGIYTFESGSFLIKTSEFPSGYVDSIYFSPNPDSNSFVGDFYGWEISKNTELNKLPQEEQYNYSNSYYLDVVDELPVPLQYSIDAIEDPSKKDSNWSKTITLPSSKRNMKALGGLHDDASTFEVYDVNNKAKCVIWSNGIPVFNGWFQLLNVSRLSYGEMGKDIEFEARLYSDTTSILNDLSKREISELDFSKWDHILNLRNVATSWVGSYDVLGGLYSQPQDVFVYPLLYTDNTENYVISNDFAPAIYAKKIVDESFRQNGYTVSYSSGITKVLDNLIIPYIGEKPLISGEYIENLDCKVAGNVYAIISQNVQWGVSYTDWQFVDYIFSSEEGFNYEEYFDLNTNEYSVSQNGIYQIDLQIPYSVFYDSAANGIDYANNNNEDTTNNSQVMLEVRKYPTDGSASQIISSTSTLISGGHIDPVDVGVNIIQTGTISLTTQADMQIGERIVVRMRILDTSRFLTNVGETPALAVLNTLEGGFFQIKPINFSVTEGSVVVINDFLPNMKQGELIKNLQKMFNWFYLIDPVKPNHISLVSRREYYENGEIIDWTEKLDNNEPVTTEFLSDVVAQNLIFSYKESDTNDTLNELYRTSNGGDIYGQKEVVFENDFVQDELTIGMNKFVPTPITKNPFGHIVPSLSLSANTKGNRLLYYGGLVPAQNDIVLSFFNEFSGLIETFNLGWYPLNIHLDNYEASTIDINYGLIKQNFTGDDVTITDNNLYNMYWKDYVRQIESGRRITAKFYLTHSDIQELEGDLSKKIFLYNKYWVISKIKDYFPNKESSTTVELASWDEITDPSFNAGSIGSINDVVVGVADSPIGGIVPIKQTDNNTVIDLVNNGSDNDLPIKVNGEPTKTLLVNGNSNKIETHIRTSAILAGNDEFVYQDHQVVLNKDYQIVDGVLQQRYFFVGGERQSYFTTYKAFRINAQLPSIVIGGRESDGYNVAFNGSHTDVGDTHIGDYDHSKGDFIVGGKETVGARPHDPRYPKVD